MYPLASPICVFLLISVLLCCEKYSEVHGFEPGFGGVSVETFVPPCICAPSKVPSGNSLKVVHRYGPCFPAGDTKPDHHKILSEDSIRVTYLQNRAGLSDASSNTTAGALQASHVSLPARNGDYIGSGSYVVTVGVGTPKRDQTVIFDTGSDLCWFQCMPCTGCYPQQEPIFDPFHSSTYHNVTCAASPCTGLDRSERGCVNNTCTYRVLYGDRSTTAGFLATETLTLTSSILLRGFVFGCGHTNRGTFRGAAGLIGLGRNTQSLVSQASSSLGNVFSYCLPSKSRFVGYLTIGRSVVLAPSYTPMLADRRGPSLYFVGLEGISVGGQRLQLSSSVFLRAGAIIDSGSMISRLPPAVYTKLKGVFRRAMSQYRLTAPFNILDTCYDFRNVTYPSIPHITLHYTGANVDVTSPAMYYVSNTTACLAFAASAKSSDFSVIGNTLQLGTEVIYDLAARRIGFAVAHCS